MVSDARTNTKTYLETYMNSANLTDDDGAQVTWIVAFGHPDYPIPKVFLTKGIDLIFSIGEPNSTPLLDDDQVPYGYDENVPIVTFCINKVSITGTNLKDTAETELRRICEEHPTGSQRSLTRSRDNDQRLGSTILYSREFVLNYRRDTT